MSSRIRRWCFFFFPMSIPLKTTVMRQMRRQAQSVSQALITNAFLVNNYTCFFLKTGLLKRVSPALIGNLMLFLTGKVKPHLKKKFLNI